MCTFKFSISPRNRWFSASLAAPLLDCRAMACYQWLTGKGRIMGYYCGIAMSLNFNGLQSRGRRITDRILMAFYRLIDQRKPLHSRADGIRVTVVTKCFAETSNKGLLTMICSLTILRILWVISPLASISYLAPRRIVSFCLFADHTLKGATVF